MKGVKVSSEEPAARRATLALSEAEVVALVAYHLKHMRRLTNLVGKTVMSSMGFALKGPAMRKAAEQIKAHERRAREVLDLAVHSLKDLPYGQSLEQVMQQARSKQGTKGRAKA